MGNNFHVVETANIFHRPRDKFVVR